MRWLLIGSALVLGVIWYLRDRDRTRYVSHRWLDEHDLSSTKVGEEGIAWKWPVRP